MTVRVSSSISNWREKILKRYGYPEYCWFSDLRKSCTFFGLYTFLDILRVVIHRGPRICFFTGSDILNLQTNKFQYGGWYGIWRKLLARTKATFYCENDAERFLLETMGIHPIVQPIILDDPNQFGISFKRSDNPQVYLCSHPGANDAYGIPIIEGLAAVVPTCTFHIYGVEGVSHDNVKFHGIVENSRFNEEIKKYSASCRLNDLDGMSEATFKSLLLGQWPISRLPFPYTTHVTDTTSLINALNDLKNKKEPNFAGRDFWLKEANKKLI